MISTPSYIARRTVPAVLSGMLLLALFCSATIRYGHADTPIAQKAEQVQPIAVGESAPRFFVPVPAVFAINTKGVVEFAHMNPDYKVRFPASALLQVAKRLAVEPPDS